jgi:hypothetical protein
MAFDGRHGHLRRSELERAVSDRVIINNHRPLSRPAERVYYYVRAITVVITNHRTWYSINSHTLI